ncbi:methyltransferase [Nocardia sp. NPDC050175]|uniref:methyltransferase n=1 Tax=Nocardia sp. NPDC050175 TaxID=3364317 RepID=UPI0037A299C8
MDVQALNFEKIKRLMLGFTAFQTLVAGCRLGVFTTLAKHPGCDRKELAAHLELSEHATRVLLLGCCTYELVTKTDGLYYNSSMSEQFLTDESMFPIIGFTEYCEVVQYKPFQLLTESLKADTNLGLQLLPGTGEGLYKRLAENPELERTFQRGMAPNDRGSRQLLFDAKEFADVHRLLDVAGGPGLIAGLLKEDHPQLEITLVDLPSVCEEASAAFAKSGSTDLHVHPGDIFVDDFPTGMDAIMFSHILEVFAEEKIIFLLEKAFDALPEGGKIFIYGMACDDDESGADMAAWGSLYFMVLASGEGMMYPVPDYRRWLTAAGFSDIVERTNDFENMIIIASK